MMRKGIALVAALTVICAAGSAWALGLGVGYRLPTGNMADLYDGGWGANFVLEFPVTPLATVYGDVGYTRFMSKSGTALGLAGLSDIDVWGFSAGAKTGLAGAGGLYLGGEVGYFTEIAELGISPLLGFGLGPLDLSARWKFTGDARWFDFRAAISLGP